MAKKNLNDCRSGKDFIKYAEKKGAIVKPAKGSHQKIKNARGTCIVPAHNKDLPTGTRKAIFKMFMQMGIVFFIGLFWICLFLRMRG